MSGPHRRLRLDARIHRVCHDATDGANHSPCDVPATTRRGPEPSTPMLHSDDSNVRLALPRRLEKRMRSPCDEYPLTPRDVPRSTVSSFTDPEPSDRATISDRLSTCAMCDPSGEFAP